MWIQCEAKISAASITLLAWIIVLASLGPYSSSFFSSFCLEEIFHIEIGSVRISAVATRKYCIFCTFLKSFTEENRNKVKKGTLKVYDNLLYQIRKTVGDNSSNLLSTVCM